MRLFIFIAIITTVLSLFSLYLGMKFIERSQWASNHQRVVWFGFLLFVALQLAGPMIYRMIPDRISVLFLFHWINYSILGVFSCLSVYVLFGDLLAKAITSLSAFDGMNLERRGFMSAALISVGSGLIGGIQAIRGPKVFEVDVPLKNLPKEFEGFTIAQISDLHVGPTIGRAYSERVAKMVESLNADLIVLTGDMIDGSVESLKHDIEPVTSLKAPSGVFFITGNHEYYWNAIDWIEEYTRCGIRTLLNEHTLITRGDAKIVLAGVTDLQGGGFHPDHASSPIKAARGAPENLIKILLAHQPKSHEEAAVAGFDLQLSGHTHGGQFFPWNLVVAMVHRYAVGLNRHEDKMWVYVSRGTGYWGPPNRLGIPSEITKITLRHA